MELHTKALPADGVDSVFLRDKDAKFFAKQSSQEASPVKSSVKSHDATADAPSVNAAAADAAMTSCHEDVQDSATNSIGDGSCGGGANVSAPPAPGADATVSKKKGSDDRWTFDEETRTYVVQCPHCAQPHLIPEDNLKCCQFSCGADVQTGRPLKPHLKRRDRDILRQQGCIVGGCGERFRFNPRKKELLKLD